MIEEPIDNARLEGDEPVEEFSKPAVRAMNEINEKKTPRFNLKPLQDIAVNRITDYCSSNLRGILLLHNVGSGKTITSIVAAINSFDWSKKLAVNTFNTIVVVHPTNLYLGTFHKDLIESIPNIEYIPQKNRMTGPEKESHEAEKRTFDLQNGDTVYKYRYHFIENGQHHQQTFCIVSKEYRSLKQIFVNGDKVKFEQIVENNIVIYDEVHRLLRPFNLVGPSYIDVMIEKQYLAKCKKLIVMSGTPISSGLSDIFKMLRLVTEFEGADISTNNSDEDIRSGKIYNFNLDIPEVNDSFKSDFKDEGLKTYSMSVVGNLQKIRDWLVSGVNNFLSNHILSNLTPTLKAYSTFKINSINSMSLYNYLYYFLGNNILENTSTIHGDYVDSNTAVYKHSLAQMIGGETLFSKYKTSEYAIIDKQNLVHMFANSKVSDMVSQIGLIDTIKDKFALASSQSNISLMNYFKKQIVDNKINEPFDIEKLASASGKYISFIDITLTNIDDNNFLNVNRAAKDLISKTEIDNETGFKITTEPINEASYESISLVTPLKYTNFANIKKVYNDKQNFFAKTKETDASVIDSIVYPGKVLNIILIPYILPQKLFRFGLENTHKYTNPNSCKEFNPFCPWYTLVDEYKDKKLMNRIPGNYSDEIDTIKVVFDKSVGDYREEHINGNKKISFTNDGLFSCPKFEKMLALLLLFKLGFMYDFQSNKFSYQPHLLTMTHELLTKMNGDNFDFGLISKHENPQEATHYFLPLVHSSSDVIGLNIFAAYLQSRGIPYLLNHEDMSKTKVAETTKNAFKKVYSRASRTEPIKEQITEILRENRKVPDNIINLIMGEDNGSRDPICLLLHPFATEGFDAVYNPAIFLMESARTYSDYEQLCGRVMRTYKRPGYTERPKKMVYQFISYTPESLYPKIQNYIGEPLIGTASPDSTIFSNLKMLLKKIDITGTIKSNSSLYDFSYHLPEEIHSIKPFMDIIDSEPLTGSDPLTDKKYVDFITRFRYNLKPFTFSGNVEQWNYLSPNMNLSEAYTISMYKNYLNQFTVHELDPDYTRVNNVLLNYAKNTSGKIYGFRIFNSNPGKEPWTSLLVDKLYKYNKTISTYLDSVLNFDRDSVGDTFTFSSAITSATPEANYTNRYMQKKLIDIYTAFYDDENGENFYDPNIISFVDKIPTPDELKHISSIMTDDFDNFVSLLKEEYFFQKFKQLLKGGDNETPDINEISRCIENAGNKKDELLNKRWCEPLAPNYEFACYNEERDQIEPTEKLRKTITQTSSAVSVAPSKGLFGRFSKGVAKVSHGVRGALGEMTSALVEKAGSEAVEGGKRNVTKNNVKLHTNKKKHKRKKHTIKRKRYTKKRNGHSMRQNRNKQ
jgi:hypothetical protein